MHFLQSQLATKSQGLEKSTGRALQAALLTPGSQKLNVPSEKFTCTQAPVPAGGVSVPRAGGVEGLAGVVG